MGILRRGRATTIAALGCSVVLLAGCAQQDEPEATETVTETGTETVISTSEPETTAPQTDTPETRTDNAQPGDPATDPATENCPQDPVNNPFTGDSPIPVDLANTSDSDIFFHYTAPAEGPEPCAALSWVELAGSNGTEDDPAGTAGSNNETVVLFADGDVVSAPAPILASNIDSVERVDDATVRVDYAFYGDAPAASGETLPGSATFHWDGSQVEVTENSIPLELNDTASTLNLG